MALALWAAPLAAPAAAESLTIAALGDSLTQGYGLAQQDGLVAQLEAWLRAAGHDVNVINAGVSGDTTAGGLSRIGWTLGDDPAGVIVALGGNDLLRGIDPAASRENLSGILTAITEAGASAMLIGLPAPGNYGPEFRDAFEAMYPELAEEYGAALYPDLLAPISEKYATGQRFSDLMQADHIHPNAEGVAAIVEALGPEVAEWLDGIAARDQ
ncbi:MAG: arylesterase [Paracoccus sp. (in: a-proteobacteria)]|nr:arylesterase [Paracoccus sp. (in: a-proteobacteria)]